jgi:hypothetical protein
MALAMYLMVEIMDEIMHYSLGHRKIYRFKYGDAEGFYISLHFTYDGFLIYIEVSWYRPTSLGFETEYAYSTIMCNYYSKSPFNNECFNYALDLAERLVKEYPVRVEIN